MWPFSKKKEPEPVIYEFPEVNRYRIKPYNEGVYYVQQWVPFSNTWIACEEFKTLGGYVHPSPVCRKTEALAEKWIAERIASEKKRQKEIDNREAFQKANPPREVPPYKYVTEETTTTT